MKRILALLVPLLLLAWPLGVSAAVQRFAVVIGNNVGHAPDLELRYAESDAAKFAQTLRDLGKFEPADTVLLRGEDADAVRRTLISVNDRVRAAQAIPGQQALLLVYYSGHADADALRLGPSRLNLRELAQLVRGSSANARLLIVDACRSGALTRLKGGRLVPAFGLSAEATLPGEGMAFLTASADHEDAQESDEIRGSFFTSALVSGLMGAADRDGDGAVVLEEAYDYARDATIRATSRTFAGTQHPSFQYELRGQDSLVLTQPGLARAQRAQLVFPKGLSFLVMADSASGAVVGEVLAAAKTPRLSVRPGRYFLRGRADEYLLEGEVTLSAGSTTTIAPDQLTRVAYARLVRKGAGVRTFSHSLELSAALRGRLPSSEQACWGAALGYRLELPWLGVGARLGACRGGFDNDSLAASSDEYSGVIELRRAWDYHRFDVFIALDVGASITRQSFDVPWAPPRVGTSPLAAGAVGIQLPLGPRYFVSARLGLETQLIDYQATALVEANKRWALTSRTLLGAGLQL